MKLMKQVILITYLCLIFQPTFSAETHYLDFKFILNSSDAGKKAQSSLKNQLENGIENLKSTEKKLQKEEQEIIQQKKVLSTDEYKKKISKLRENVSSLQKNRNALLETIAKKRSKARKEILKKLNPIVKNYMQKNNIRIVLDKKHILLGDEELNITKDVMNMLNKELKTINLN